MLLDQITPQCLVLLPGHVGAKDGLHDQGSCLRLSVALASHTHPLVLLDGGGRMNLPRELPAGLVDPLVNLWMWMTPLRQRRKFLQASQQRTVFSTRRHA